MGKKRSTSPNVVNIGGDQSSRQRRATLSDFDSGTEFEVQRLDEELAENVEQLGLGPEQVEEWESAVSAASEVTDDRAHYWSLAEVHTSAADSTTEPDVRSRTSPSVKPDQDPGHSTSTQQNMIGDQADIGAGVHEQVPNVQRERQAE
jgi:hypothetical protein